MWVSAEIFSSSTPYSYHHPRPQVASGLVLIGRILYICFFTNTANTLTLWSPYEIQYHKILFLSLNQSFFNI
ncbi:unnamed protein product [Rotaria magnacalcarata]|uniref:Uncharacterized protein n=1 Tax=Rotaria magnacalcarata TaxID=392030 RepID=A0A816ZUS6_9BILA|nr:unnamed protein product [Rotaria magnacalcarata]CAF2004506.1 unnamed protein product [Rotaria magnacalcarata]CAF2226636.1 unnamed protein product [Rotaria magnacalcarata]